MIIRVVHGKVSARLVHEDFQASMQTATALCINTGNRATVWNIGTAQNPTCLVLKLLVREGLPTL